MISSQEILEDIRFKKKIEDLKSNGLLEERVKILKDSNTADWKSDSISPRGTIPAGSIVKREAIIRNFYGNFAQVTYNGHLFYIDLDDTEYLGLFDTKTNEQFVAVKWTKKDGRPYKEWNVKAFKKFE